MVFPRRMSKFELVFELKRSLFVSTSLTTCIYNDSPQVIIYKKYKIIPCQATLISLINYQKIIIEYFLILEYLMLCIIRNTGVVLWHCCPGIMTLSPRDYDIVAQGLWHCCPGIMALLPRDYGIVAQGLWHCCPGIMTLLPYSRAYTTLFQIIRAYC